MNEKLMKKNGLTKEQFEPTEEHVTTQDLVEAINTLTDIIMGEEEE